MSDQELPGHRIRYTDGVTFLVVWVPWDFGTGQIPPPFLDFPMSGGGPTRRFVYDGSPSDD